MKHLILPALLLAVALGSLVSAQKPGAPGLRLERKDHLLTIRGPGIPAEGIGVNYLEAYCRAGSTEAGSTSAQVTCSSQNLSKSGASRSVTPLRRSVILQTTANSRLR